MSGFEKSFINISALLVLILFFWTTTSIIRFPYGVDYGEAPLMDQVRRIESSEVLYKANINEPPYIIANYPPLYPSVVAVINSFSRIPLFQSGRLVTLFFSLISGTVVGLLSYLLTGNRYIGIFASVLFWGQPYVMIWSSLARVDLMALAFSLIGLLILFLRFESRPWLILACLCFLFSAFTRQTYLLAGPLAGFVWIWQHNRRHALVFISLFACSGFLIFELINLLTHNGFYTNIIVSNINQYDLSRTIIMIRQLLIIWPVVILISIIFFFLMIWKYFRKQFANQEGILQKPFVFYSLTFYSLGALLSALTVGKVGSDVNYFLEIIVASTIWCAMAIKFFSDQKKAIKLTFFGCLFFQIIWMLAGCYLLNRTTIGERWHQLAFYDKIFQQVQSATKKGIVLSDDYLDMVVLSNQAIYYQPFEYGQLYHAGLWDATQLADEIKEQKFPLVLIGGLTLDKECCWPPTLSDALEKSYRIEANNNMLILTPIR